MLLRTPVCQTHLLLLYIIYFCFVHHVLSLAFKNINMGHIVKNEGDNIQHKLLRSYNID